MADVTPPIGVVALIWRPRTRTHGDTHHRSMEAKQSSPNGEDHDCTASLFFCLPWWMETGTLPPWRSPSRSPMAGASVTLTKLTAAYPFDRHARSPWRCQRLAAQAGVHLNQNTHACRHAGSFTSVQVQPQDLDGQVHDRAYVRPASR
jgi:hypothetical protein